MKIAIVGSSLIYENEIDHVRQLCVDILQNHNDNIENTVVISGGSKGVDRIALDVALRLGFKIKEYLPTQRTWQFFKERNLKIVKECDRLYCISTPVHFIKCFHHSKPQDHEKTAGCWTMNKAIEANKPSKFLITPTLEILENESN